MKKNSLLPYITLAISLLTLFYTFYLHQKMIEAKMTYDSVIKISTEATDSIKEYRKSMDTQFSEALTNSSEEFNSLLQSHSEENLQKSLETLTTEFRKKNEELNLIQRQLKQTIENNERALSNLPSSITLKQLNNKYAKLFREKPPTSAIESFTTSLGNISFYRSDFNFKYHPKPGSLVKLNIGKMRYSDSFEMMDEWLNLAEQSKLDNGYTLVQKDNKRTKYGEASWKVLQKGDLYCKIYKESTRYKGDTYNSTHIYYTFYVEVGSLEGVDRLIREEYNNKLGS